MTEILDLLATILIASMSFFAWHLLGKQVLYFYEIRKQIQEELIYGSNLWSPKDKFFEEEIHGVIRKTKRLSAQLRALEHSLNTVSRFFICNILSMNLSVAAGGLWIYHNDPLDTDALRTESRHTIENALKLPITDTPEKIAQIRIVRGIEKQLNVRIPPEN